MANNNKKLVDLLDKNKDSNKKNYRRVDDINSQDNNILDSYMRSRVNKKRSTQSKKDSTTFYLEIIAKQSSFLKPILQNIFVIKNSILDLVKIEEESKANEFFMRQKERENLLEEQRKKTTRKDAKFAISPTSEQTKDSDKKTIFESLDESFKLFKNIILKIVGIFGAIFSGLRKLFSSKNFGNFFKIFGRIFIVLGTIYSLFKSLSKAYQTYKETGSIKESILTFFGSFIESITMGLFTEDSVKNFFNDIGNFLGPIIDSIKETFNHVKDCLSEMISNVWNWVVNNFGIPKISLPSIKNPFTGTEYNLDSIGPYYPLKDNPRSEEDQKVVKKEKTTTQDITEASKELNTKKLKSTLKRYNQSWESEKSKLDPNAPDYEKKLAKINKKWQGKTESVQKEINKIEGITETQNAVNIQTQSTPTANIDASVNPSIDVSSKQTSMSATPAATSVTSSSIATPSIDINANYTSTSTSAPVQSVKSPAESTSTPTSVQSATPVAVSKPMSTVGRSSISNHVSPKDITPAPMQDKPLTSGSELSTSSTQIAESQRMESAADQGTIINSPTNNITKTAQDKSEQSVADVYDTDFMAYLIST